MPKLLLPKEEIVKALAVHDYQDYLRTRYDLEHHHPLVPRVYNGEYLSKADYAPILESGQQMASFIDSMLEALPANIAEAFRDGWNAHGIERGRILCDRFLSAAAELPEGPFFYLLASSYSDPNYRVKRSDTDDWNELFSGVIVGMVKGCNPVTPALQTASERLQAFAEMIVDEEKIRKDHDFHQLSYFDKAILVQRALKGELVFMAAPSSEAGEILRALEAKDAAYAGQSTASKIKPH